MRWGRKRWKHASCSTARLLITELVASNEQGLEDENGDASDWIEIHNAGDAPANLDGWHLTDDNDRLTKWTFPAVTIEPDDYLVVFASGKDRIDPARPLHTNFQLDADGEYLARSSRMAGRWRLGSRRVFHRRAPTMGTVGLRTLSTGCCSAAPARSACSYRRAPTAAINWA